MDETIDQLIRDNLQYSRGGQVVGIRSVKLRDEFKQLIEEPIRVFWDDLLFLQERMDVRSQDFTEEEWNMVEHIKEKFQETFGHYPKSQNDSKTG